MDSLTLAASLNWIGKLIYNNLYIWVESWGNDLSFIGAFGITVIIFTLCLKLATLPLDVWQKVLGRKSSKKMEIMKPELDRVTKQCGDNRELLMQKQREVYKKYKYNAFSACLPMLVTLAVFWIVFTGFNSAVNYHNRIVYEDLARVYHSTYGEKISDLEDSSMTAAEKKELAVKAAEDAVVAFYKPERFLLTINIFMPDSYVSPIPTISTFSGSGMGKLNITDVDKTEYESVMKPLIEKYNKTENGKNRWNGYFILPALAFILSILSTKLIKPPEQPPMAGQTEEQVRAQKSQAKMMAYMMPIMFGVFTIFYSTAFALYMVVSNVFSTTFNLIYNIFAKRTDKKARDYMLSTTIKK
jgi:membrane protein insertase, YidC/Oxa1 family, C-terminal domain